MFHSSFASILDIIMKWNVSGKQEYVRHIVFVVIKPISFQQPLVGSPPKRTYKPCLTCLHILKSILVVFSSSLCVLNEALISLSFYRLYCYMTLAVNHDAKVLKINWFAIAFYSSLNPLMKSRWLLLYQNIFEFQIEKNEN